MPGHVRHGLLVGCLLLPALLTGCTGLSPGDGGPGSGGIVVTSQALLDSAVALGAADEIAGYPDWLILPEPLPGQPIGRPFTLPAEEVLSLEPRLVLDQPHPLVSGPDRQALATAARQAGIAYQQVPTEPSLATVAQTLWAVANATERDPTPVLDGLRANLSETQGAVAGLEAPRVLVLFPAGLTAGTGTDVDLVLELSGVRNVAAEAGLEGYRQISQEAVQRVGVDLVVATATMRASPPEIAAMPMLEGTPVAGNASRVLVVDPAHTTRVGPHLDRAVAMLAAWAHPELDGPRVHAWVQPSKAPACTEVTLHAPDQPELTGELAGQTVAPGTFTVPELPGGHYRLTARAAGPGTPFVDLILTVEGERCDA